MNIENTKGTLQNLLLKVQEQNNRSADFLASTSNLQKATNCIRSFSGTTN